MSLRTTGDGFERLKRKLVLIDYLDIFRLGEKHCAGKKRAHRFHLEPTLPGPDDIVGGHFVAGPALDPGAQPERPGLEVLASLPLVHPAADHARVAGCGHISSVDALGASGDRLVLHQIARIGQRQHVLHLHREGDLVHGWRAGGIGSGQCVSGGRFVGRYGSISGKCLVCAGHEGREAGRPGAGHRIAHQLAAAEIVGMSARRPCRIAAHRSIPRCGR